MKSISSYIFNLSPKKLAIYLVLGPLVLFFVHTIITIAFRTISGTSAGSETTVQILLGMLFLFLATIVLLWLFWLRSTVFTAEESELGLPKKWFNLAFVVFIVYLLYNCCHFLIDYVQEDYRHIFYALNEFIAFGGLLIAYPVICHYAARAIVVKKDGKPATFISALPYSLLLIFGTVIGIPFLHKYFSSKTSTNNQIIIIYAIAFGLFAVIFVIGFLAAITGLI